MSQIAIRIEGLGKRYRIGEKLRYGTLRDTLANLFRPHKSLSPKGRDESAGVESPNYIWALKDISFEINRGEIVGIIGPNGAGKSTLLKILCRITEPTKGYAEIYGRVSALLEVGTGFHPELTGRENVYLNGSILGMRKWEIDKKFAEIVDFSGVARFIDTPLKHYSSGMQVRLAFAVAAHLESEIILVDEVLAVGDAAFQKRCLGKMGDVAKEGRTVLFVSHNMLAIRDLCSKTILLEKSRIAKIGDTADIVNLYLMNGDIASGGEVNIVPRPFAEVSFTKVWITDMGGKITSNIDVKDQFRVWLEFMVNKPMDGAEISVGFSNPNGVNVFFTSLSDSYNGKMVNLEKGKYLASVLINGNFLMPNNYFLRVSVHHRGLRDIDLRENILRMTIVETGSTMAPYGNRANYLSCVLGGAKWNLDGYKPPESIAARNLT